MATHRAVGFTLLEIVVSIALGMIIILVAYAGFRAAAQTVTRVNRISLENRLVRAGILYALYDVDTWSSLDRPDDQRLRTVPTKWISTRDFSYGYREPGYGDVWYDQVDGSDWRQLGQPFTPLSAVHPTGGRVWSWLVSAAARARQAWLFDQRKWLPHHPESWFRGDLGASLTLVNANNNGHFFRYQFAAPVVPNRLNKSFVDYGMSASDRAAAHALMNRSEMHYADRNPFGAYAAFACVEERFRIGPDGAEVTSGARPDTPADYAAALDSTYTWQANQHKLLKDALGFYGWLDYLPANAIVWYEDVYGKAGDPARDPDGRKNGRPMVPTELRWKNDSKDRKRWKSETWSTRGLGFLGMPTHQAASGGQQRPVDPAALTAFCGLTVTGDVRFDDPHAARHNRSSDPPLMRNDDQGIRALSSIALTMQRASRPTPLTGWDPASRRVLRPEGWPEVTVDVRRIKLDDSTSPLCVVRWVDPVSGKATEISFLTVGTTLRGARLNRTVGGRTLDAP